MGIYTTIPSTLDVRLEPAERAFLRKVFLAGGRYFIETDADERCASASLILALLRHPGKDRRCVEITEKGKAYLDRTARAH